MKKIILILSIITALLSTGCNSKKNTENLQSQENIKNEIQEEITDNTNDMHESTNTNENDDEIFLQSFEERTADFTNWMLQRDINNKAIYQGYIGYFVDNIIFNVRLEKINNHYLIKTDIMHPKIITKSEIENVIQEIELNNLETAKLGEYTVYSFYPEHFNAFYYDYNPEIDESKIDKNKWYSENRIPLFIEDNGFWINLESKPCSSDEYVVYHKAIPMEWIELGNVETDAFTIHLLPDDKMRIVGKSDEYDMTVEEYYTRAINDYEHEDIKYSLDNLSTLPYSEGDSIKIEDGILHIYQNETVF